MEALLSALKMKKKGTTNSAAKVLSSSLLSQVVLCDVLDTGNRQSYMHECIGAYICRM